MPYWSCGPVAPLQVFWSFYEVFSYLHLSLVFCDFGWMNTQMVLFHHCAMKGFLCFLKTPQSSLSTLGPSVVVLWPGNSLPWGHGFFVTWLYSQRLGFVCVVFRPSGSL